MNGPATPEITIIDTVEPVSTFIEKPFPQDAILVGERDTSHPLLVFDHNTLGHEVDYHPPRPHATAEEASFLLGHRCKDPVTGTEWFEVTESVKAVGAYNLPQRPGEVIIPAEAFAERNRVMEALSVGTERLESLAWAHDHTGTAPRVEDDQPPVPTSSDLSVMEHFPGQCSLIYRTRPDGKREIGIWWGGKDGEDIIHSQKGFYMMGRHESLDRTSGTMKNVRPEDFSIWNGEVNVNPPIISISEADL